MIVTMLLKLVNDILKVASDVAGDTELRAEIQLVIDDVESIIALITGKSPPEKEIDEPKD